jgi:hypothetical protein
VLVRRLLDRNWVNVAQIPTNPANPQVGTAGVGGTWPSWACRWGVMQQWGVVEQHSCVQQGSICAVVVERPCVYSKTACL